MIRSFANGPESGALPTMPGTWTGPASRISLLLLVIWVCLTMPAAIAGHVFSTGDGSSGRDRSREWTPDDQESQGGDFQTQTGFEAEREPDDGVSPGDFESSATPDSDREPDDLPGRSRFWMPDHFPVRGEESGQDRKPEGMFP